MVRRSESPELVLSMMIWGVASFLSTRWYLHIMGNPQIRFGGWHIAHVLWGGIFMLIGTLIIFSFEGEKARRLSAAVSGIGWGLFVDEIGKYLTTDNNYWFRPAVLLIYLSFVILFFVYRRLLKHQERDNKEKLYLIVSELENIVEQDLEKRERNKILQKIGEINYEELDENSKILVTTLRDALGKMKPVKDREKYTTLLLQKIFRIGYSKVFRRKLVMFGLMGYAIYFSFDKVIESIRILMSPQKLLIIQKFYEDYDFFGKSDLYMISLKIIFDVITALFFLGGARYFWTKKRVRGVKLFVTGLYVSVLFSAPISFYFEQLKAIFELGLSFMMIELLQHYRKELVLWRR